MSVALFRSNLSVAMGPEDLSDLDSLYSASRTSTPRAPAFFVSRIVICSFRGGIWSVTKETLSVVSGWSPAILRITGPSY